MGKHNNATKGGSNAQKAPPPLCHLMQVRQVTQAMQFMTWGMRKHHWRKHYHKWVLLPKFPSALGDATDYHQNDLYHLSINKAIQHIKIWHAIAPKLEWLQGKEEVTSPHFPCIDQLINCWHVPGWPWWMNYRSCGLSPQGSDLIFQMTITQRGVSSWWHKGRCIPLGWPS